MFRGHFDDSHGHEMTTVDGPGIGRSAANGCIKPLDDSGINDLFLTG